MNLVESWSSHVFTKKWHKRLAALAQRSDPALVRCYGYEGELKAQEPRKEVKEQEKAQKKAQEVLERHQH
eukprot:Skav203247  [mRNA]  locus=scaffold2454:88684:88893:- [translate_table: standard]